MDEPGLSLKALPDTGLVKTNRKRKGSKRSNSNLLQFFVSSSGFKVFKPGVIGKGTVPWWFWKLHNPSKSYGMQYF